MSWDSDKVATFEPDDAETDNALTPWEEYLKKKRDKKKAKKNKAEEEEEEEGVVDDGDGDDVPEDVDLNDPFFADEFKDVKRERKSGKKRHKKQQDYAHDPADADPERGPSGLDLIVMDSDDEKSHFNYKDIVEKEERRQKDGKGKKWKRKKKRRLGGAEEEAAAAAAVDNFKVDVTDARFSALYSRPDYNIDPSEPSFKRTKAMEEFISEKQTKVKQRRETGTKGEEEGAGAGEGEVAKGGGKKRKMDPSLAQSLKSVKNKWSKNAKKRKVDAR